ncbi:MAG: phage terminase large subunit family protein [Candidatus Binatia bacterium]
MRKLPDVHGNAKPANLRQLARLSELTRLAATATSADSRGVETARQLTFLDWVIRGSFVADRERVNFAVWRYLRAIYGAVPKDPTGLDMVIMKPSQAGATIFGMLFCLWLTLRMRCQGAYFLPTADMALKFSQNRFIRLARDNDPIHKLMGDPASPHEHRIVDEGSASVRRILQSILYFSYMGGAISTESLPLDFLVLDEVQEMLLEDIQKAEERLSASTLRAVLRMSTANFAGADVHYYYERSDQREFHTRCRCTCEKCGNPGIVLTECWDSRLGPLCIKDEGGAVYYQCPRCTMVLENVQDGAFYPHNPGARRIGFHWGQMLSPRQSARDILEKWRNSPDTGTFYRRVLGLPYADPATLPVTQAHLAAAQRPELRWGLPAVPRALDGTFMGVDQMGQVNYCVLKGRDAQTGRQQLLHLEVIQAEDPWERCAALMHEYRVTICATEALPNFNEAFRFAKRFNGKVFVVDYADLADELVLWGDRPKDKVTVRRTDQEARLRYVARVDQFRMMSWSLGRWSNLLVDTPDARTLLQSVRTPEGVAVRQVCRDLFWLHLQRVALVTELREGKTDERRFRRAVKKVGIDPHFAFANMLCDVAWVRAHGTEMLLGTQDTGRILIDPPGPLRNTSYLEQIVEGLPEVFAGAGMRMLSPISRDANAPACGSCWNRDKETNYCRARYWTVQPEQPPCAAYAPEEEAPTYP